MSQGFEDRISDINAWTMGPGMFERWPEFYSDIPTFNSIPGKVSTTNITSPLIQKAPIESLPTATADEEESFEDDISSDQTIDPWSISWMLSTG